MVDKKKIGLALAALALLLLLSGCFSNAWVITLKRDGSGTVTVDYRVNQEVMGMLSGEESQGAPPQSSADLIDVEAMQRLAARMGEGVRYVSAEPAAADSGFLGYKAVFAFDDISQLRLDPMAGTPSGDDDSAEPDDDSIPFSFAFDRGAAASTVTVYVEQSESDSEESESLEPAPQEGGMDNAAVGQMMKPFFESMAFSVTLVIDGDIKESSATYQDGKVVTLMDFDMGKIMGDDTLYTQVLESENLQDEEIQPLLEEAGIKIETREEVVIRFR